jgi:DNA polymerase-4
VPLGKRIRLLGVKVSGLIAEQLWQASAHDPVAQSCCSDLMV